MVAKRGFLDPTGEEETIETTDALSISETDVAYAGLPAAVQTAAAALSASTDFRLAQMRTVGLATKSFWFSRAAGTVAIS